MSRHTSVFSKGHVATSWLTAPPPVVDARTGQPDFLPFLNEGDFVKGRLEGKGKRCCLLGWVNWSFEGTPVSNDSLTKRRGKARRAFESLLMLSIYDYVAKNKSGVSHLTAAINDGQRSLPYFNDDSSMPFSALPAIWNKAVRAWLKT